LAAPKRTKIQRENDLQEIARLYLKGWSQHDIETYIARNRDYGISRQMVGYDLKAIQKRWLASSVRDFDEARAQELAKLDELERVAWDAYELSKEPIIKRKTAKKVDGETTEATQEVSLGYGDPRFLDKVSWCIDRRCKLLGLDTQIGNSDETPFIIKILKGVSMDDL